MFKVGGSIRDSFREVRDIVKVKISRERLVQWIPVMSIIVLASLSFVYGWYIDDSKPVSGVGWADQDTYRNTASKLYNLERLGPQDFHYSLGYPILGSLSMLVARADPFVIVSYVLFLSSVVFCFYAGRRLVGPTWTIVFLILLFAWDGVARTFNYVPELFAVPWNNQVLFFAMAFYFWVFSTKLPVKSPSWRLIIIFSVISGYTFLTREESILFVLPAVIAFLYLSRAQLAQWIAAVCVVFICFLPQVILKSTSLGSVADSGRKSSYVEMTKQYLQPSLLKRNFWEVIVNPRHYGTTPTVPAGAPAGYENLFRRGSPDPQRNSLIQAAPWLVLAPIGFLLVLMLRRYPLGLKVFFILSAMVLFFYLSGVNMSGHKLKYHAIRYISSSFIALNLATVITLREGVRYVRVRINR